MMMNLHTEVTFLFLLLLFVGCSQLRSSIYFVESGNNERNETSILQQRYRDGAHCTQRYYYRHQSSFGITHGV